MIGEYNKFNALPLIAASDLDPHRVVRLDPGADRQALVVATANVEPLGVIGPATALQGNAVTVYNEGAVVEAVAGASLGAGADIGVASTNGALAPLAGASGAIRHRVGQSVESAAAGEKFSLYVNPKQLSDGGAI